jgi:hypothetical protein
MSPTAAQLLVEAANCGLHITGLDGWTQTRLAKTLQIRRETLNAIINRSPSAEPTDDRPRMFEACQKLITFAAALSAKDDEVLKLPIDVGNLQSDDGQAYEHHRLRLHQLVEAAVAENQFTNALCRMGEFASSAVHAEPRFRIRMICNLVTAIQRMLDKPASKDIPPAVLRANIGRLYRAERTAIRTGRAAGADASAQEQLAYVRGQAGYGLIFSGISLDKPRLIERGGRRLFEAARVQPDASYGHWCNLLRAINDLLGCQQQMAEPWANRAITLATAQGAAGYAAAYTSLLSRGELLRLQGYWQKGSHRLVIARLLKRSATPRPAALARRAMMWIVAAMIAASCFASAPRCLAGDGRDFKAVGNLPDPPRAKADAPKATTNTPPIPTTITIIGVRGMDGGAIATIPGRQRMRERPVGIYVDPDFNFEPTSPRVAASATERIETAIVMSTIGNGVYGENINSYVQAGGTHRHAPITPIPEPAKVEPPRPVVRPVVAEQSATEKAAQALVMAKNYLSIGNDETAQMKLQTLIKLYPETAAAKEAKTLLTPGK